MKASFAFMLLAAVAQAQFPSYKALKYPPLRQVKIPDVATYTLPNGMRLYLLENHELPLVRGVALVRTGNLFDPPDKVGLATVTGELMRGGGTKEKTGDQLDEQLENIAASVESQIGESSGSVSFSTLKERTDEVLGVFKDVMTAPEFREDKIDLIKNQLRSSISRRNDDAQGIAQREFADLLYGRDTPYGWQMEYSTVNAIQRDDLIKFYKRYFFPANVLLAVQGDFTTAEMRAKLEKLFGGWNYRQEPVPAFPPVRQRPEPGVYLAAKTDVTQTSFILGQLGGELNDKDYPALEVMADILGGGFRSRLFQRVRTQLGYAYNISSSWGAGYDHPGLFEVAGSTKSLSTTEAIKVAEEEINKIRTSEVTTDELETAIQSVLNSFVFNFDTRSKTLNRLLIYEYYGYPKDFIYQYQKGVAAVTKADILRVAKDRLHPKDLTVLAVGNKKDFGEPLTALGMPITPLDISIPEPKTEKAAIDLASIENGKQLLQKVQQAVGGADKLAAVHDFEEKVDFQVDASAGGMKVNQLIQWVAPSYFRQDSVLPFGKMSAYSDGQTGWIVTPQGAGPLPPAQLKQIQEELFRVYFPLLLSDRSPDRTVNLVGEGVVEISGKGGMAVRLYVDSKTNLPMKETYQSAQQQGPPTAIEETFSNFEAVQGIQTPRKLTIVQNGHKFADIAVRELKINSGLKPEDLSKKP
ncbi:MAG: insulinase family protein [Acidobacteriota bacterium]|nr:insulinase family protein [Acidobacteriota bacterium]